MARLRVVSLGWFGHQNCGDEAFRHALLELYPGVELNFIGGIAKNHALLKESDYLLIGGGNIVDPVFLRGLEDVCIPYSFVGIGVIPGNDLGLLSRAQNIVVRDQDSFDLVSKLRPDSILAPDLAFSLSPNRQSGKELLHKLPGISAKKRTVGVFLNDCVSTRFDSTILKFMECEKVKLELSRFIENLPYNVVFIPMSTLPPDDRRISLDVVGTMKNGYKYHCITESLHPIDCLDLISALDFAVTMRLHASIFCTIAGVPFMDLTHHDKSRGYLKSIDETILSIDYYGLNLGVLQEKFDYLEQNQEAISRRLTAKAANNKGTLEVSLKHVPIPQGRSDKTH
jgi:polysaccharide pyruvyl transferase WcaK-like protein